MAEQRANPYLQFNFTVDLGGGVAGGFQEISGIGMEVSVAEYRNGDEKTNNTRKITGLNKATDVTLKRGAIGALDLYKWLSDIRDGKDSGIRKAVTIALQSEDRSKTAFTWSLKNARIIKYTGGPMNAKGSDVAMEELVLAYERLEME
jgi:phage tail-like protein